MSVRPHVSAEILVFCLSFVSSGFRHPPAHPFDRGAHDSPRAAVSGGRSQFPGVCADRAASRIRPASATTDADRWSPRRSPAAWTRARRARARGLLGGRARGGLSRRVGNGLPGDRRSAGAAAQPGAVAGRHRHHGRRWRPAARQRSRRRAGAGVPAHRSAPGASEVLRLCA